MAIPPASASSRPPHSNGASSLLLPELPAELLLRIFSHLPFSSLASLSLTCRGLHRSVDEIGWTTWLLSRSEDNDPDPQRRIEVLSREEGNQSGLKRVREMRRCDEVWASKAVRARGFGYKELLLASSGSDAMEPINGSGGRPPRDWPAFPCAKLCAQGLIVAMRSLVVFWSSASLQDQAGICSDRKPRVYHLGEASGWQEINAVEVLEAQPDSIVLAVGRFHGVLELWRLPIGVDDGGGGKARARGMGSCEPSPGKPGSVQSISYLPEERLLAIGWKDGHVALYTLNTRCELEPLFSWKIPRNAKLWCLHLGLHYLGGEPWLAIGCQANTEPGCNPSPLIIYTDVLHWANQCAAAHREGRPRPSPAVIWPINPSRTSIYALASPRPSMSSPTFPTHTLYAGCHNGTIVALDVSQGGKFLARYRDAYDDSPVYSLSLGVGQGSRSIAAGTGRHGCLKLYEQGRDREPLSYPEQHGDVPKSPGEGGEGWTLFPPSPPPCNSPTYAVVGEHGRLFCAGREKCWEFDARGTARSGMRDEAIRCKGAAWYRHREMVLMRTCGEEGEGGEKQEEEKKDNKKKGKRWSAGGKGFWRGRRR
ncbi:hypothetical protein BDZ90DRAFT_280414 [Jaminaea rosea]|uniref:F-box domain-containing protein n=1 Tax=Jaminaea rosea TaxID=1569628 RepID=A0A316UNQ8_9BASI|nr:hypothetical protein BDZ90DRAFT_280414 [Jaminaea rosea]PWN26942.1 hypothetical protein BDZ90DRAFT_280414 [Jaminaea rosea]